MKSPLISTPPRQASLFFQNPAPLSSSVINPNYALVGTLPPSVIIPNYACVGTKLSCQVTFVHKRNSVVDRLWTTTTVTALILLRGYIQSSKYSRLLWGTTRILFFLHGLFSFVFFLSTKMTLWFFAERKSTRDIRIVFVNPIVTFEVNYQFSGEIGSPPSVDGVRYSKSEVASEISLFIFYLWLALWTKSFVSSTCLWYNNL